MAQSPSLYDHDADTHPVHHQLPPSDEGMRHLTGISKSEEAAIDKSAQQPTDEEGGQKADADEGEGLAGQDNSRSDNDPANEGGFFRNYKNSEALDLISAFRKNKNKIKLGVLAASGLVTIISALFMSLGSLNLSNFMANIEQKAFMRYQVDLNGRSSKWLTTYMVLRFGEVENDRLAPKDRNNLLFRADKVDNNKYMTDWYRTLRASKFEQEVFEKHGIKFTSYTYQDGNSIRFRPAKVIINDKPITFDISSSEIEALQNGDINSFNGRLFDSVEKEMFQNDKQARVAIAQVLRDEYPQWWNAVKRYHLRHDIQNMIGVRKWSFFENKRQQVRESVQDRRNNLVKKFVDQSLPEDSKSGKFIECLFGLSNCKATSDPANPEGRAGTAAISDSTREGDTINEDTNGDGVPDKSVSDGSGVNSIQDASSKAAAAGDSLRSILPKILKSVNIAAVIDGLARFDKALHDHSLSKFVTQARTQYAMGIYTTLKIADDQWKTGEMDSQEVGDFMSQYGDLANSEGWDTVVMDHSSSTVSADSTSYTPAKNKAEFCSEKHQTEMEKPENKTAAEQEFQFMCPSDKIGGGSLALDIENAWDQGPGLVLHSILSVYRSTVGTLFDILGKVTSFVTEPLLKVTGIDGKIEDIVGYAGSRAVEFAGANMDVNAQTPSGRVGNLALEGGTATAEAHMRQQGGSLTTQQTRALTDRNVLAYEAEQRQTGSFQERYFSLSNPQSLLSRQIPTIAKMSQMRKLDLSGLATMFTSPLKLFSLPANAANEDGYAAARFAGIETYDLAQCVNINPLTMTPQSVTNADDLGYFKPEELTWDLMSDKEKWYDALYQKVGNNEDKAKQVYNCALFDNTVRGGIGANYGYKGNDAFQAATTSSDATSGSASAPEGSAQDLAKQLTNSKGLSGDPRYIGQIQAVARGDLSCNVNPAILKMLVGVIVQDNHSLYISSLNRKCTGVLTASGTASYHYSDGGGHAVDVTQFDGEAVNGSGGGTVKYLQAASKYLPTNTGYGQVQTCHSGFNIPSGSYAVPDTCDHEHIQVPKAQAK